MSVAVWGEVIVWLALAVILGIVEGLTVSLVSIWMAVAAIVSAIVAFFGGSVMMQILTFALVSALLLVLTAPLSKKFRSQKKATTNADRLLNQTGIVIQRIDPIENKGQIKAMGQIWSAAGKEGDVIEAGEKVVVLSIEGVHAIVKKAE